MGNPEFRRLLWLELGPQRLTVTAVALLAVFVLAGLFDPQGFGPWVANVALMIFVVFTVGWGGQRASEAVLEELRDRTWDTQRMSALAPWTMTWGKLLGATALAWFGGLICLVVYCVGSTQEVPAHTAQVVLAAVSGAVLVHALNLIGALTIARRGKRIRGVFGSRVAAAGLAAVWIYFAIVTRGEQTLQWYGMPVAKFEFMVLALLLFTLWAILGAYRMMCTELQVATRPWAWPSFLLYCALFAAGGYIEAAWPLLRGLKLVSALGLLVALIGTYLSAFSLYRDPLCFRRLRTYQRQDAWRRVIEEAPLWLVGLLLAGVFTVACVALSAGQAYSGEQIENVGLSAIALWLYALRDLLILFYSSFQAKAERAETGTLIYLALLYWILPSILQTAGLTQLSWLLRPPLWEHPVPSAVVILLHSVACGWLVWQRYRTQIAPSAPT